MHYIIMLFGAATTIAGVIIVISPETVFGLIRKHLASMGIHVLAVVMRIVRGATLILCAAESKFPAAIEVIGWITLVAALMLGIMGRVRLKRLIAWALGLPSPFKRMGGVLAALLGGFDSGQNYGSVFGCDWWAGFATDYIRSGGLVTPR